MSAGPEHLRIYEVGTRIVVGFGGSEVLDQVSVAEYRDELLSLILEHEAETVAFDLEGVRLIPSGLLGLLASLREQGVTVELYNPSDDVRDVLNITQLHRVLTICDGPVPGTGDD